MLNLAAATHCTKKALAKKLLSATPRTENRNRLGRRIPLTQSSGGDDGGSGTEADGGSGDEVCRCGGGDGNGGHVKVAVATSLATRLSPAPSSTAVPPALFFHPCSLLPCSLLPCSLLP